MSEKIPGKCAVDSMQTTAMLGTSQMSREVLHPET
jgi:hypothetical protein